MRHSKATVAAGHVRGGARGVRRTIVVAVVTVLAIWTAYAFAQEAYIGHRLAQQVSDLHRTNARLAAENSGYHKDVQSVTSGVTQLGWSSQLSDLFVGIFIIVAVGTDLLRAHTRRTR